MQLSDFAPQLLALLAGALISSLGPGIWVRRPRGRAWLSRVGGWALTAFVTVSLAVAAVAVYWGYSRIVAIPETLTPVLGTPLQLLALGLAVGLPCSTPSVLYARHELRRLASEKEARKNKPPSRAERVKYARELATQIREVSPERSGLSATVSGEDGEVLVFEGPLERREGDRLVAALRADLEDRGFKRVEGEGPGGKWWSRV